MANSTIKKSPIYTEVLSYKDGRLTPTVTPYQSMPLCVVGRGGASGAICVFWYKSTEAKFVLGASIIGTPTEDEAFRISYPI